MWLRRVLHSLGQRSRAYQLDCFKVRLLKAKVSFCCVGPEDQSSEFCAQSWEAGTGVDCLAGTLKCVTHPPWETLSTVLSALGTSLHSKDGGSRQQGIIYPQEQFPCHSQPAADSAHQRNAAFLCFDHKT